MNSYKEKIYLFDYAFNENDNSETVYQRSMTSLLENVLNGFNGTLFAYGMTGAGKTHTLFGDMQGDTLSADTSGIVMLTLNDLFNRISNPPFLNAYDFLIKVSYLEIYNEHVKDLLKGDGQNLLIVEDPIRGIFVADLLETPVYTLNDVLNLISFGNERRNMASTTANQFSSRSHAIIQILIERKNKTRDIVETMSISKLSLIDLAGSERAAVTDNKGIRMLEGANINKSLLSLGNCINILSDSAKRGAFVPYRDSKLTRLLKDSLGGNTKTIMIACISPFYSCYEETVNTLKYASRAKNIKKIVQQNVKEIELHASQYKEIIESLKGEITQLREQLNVKSIGSPLALQLVLEKKDMPLQNLTSSLNFDQIFDSDAERFNPENNLDEASDKILENLEQHWEINQTLRELSDLENQNKNALINLEKLLQTIPEEDIKKLENVNKQILLLKNTMQNNEKIKKDMESTLKINIMENRILKNRLIEFTSSAHTIEDLQVAKKLLDIEKLDVVTQNVEIKKEALNLAKDKMMKSKQICQMEEEMRLMRQEIDEKNRLIACNHEIINHLVFILFSLCIESTFLF